MNNVQERRAGFSIAEGLLIVFVIAVLGVSSWMVYQRIKTSSSTTGATGSTTQNNQQTPAPPAPTVTYLEIKEWGIKLPLSDSIKDATYIPSMTIVDSEGKPAAMWVTVGSLTAKGCVLSNRDRDGGGAIGEIFRVTPDQVNGVTGELYTKEYPNGTTIGNYYYAYKSWATSNTCASAADQQAPDSAFTSAVNGHIQASTAMPTN